MSRFADITVEWRVAAIESSLQQKANEHEVSSLRGNVDSLERSNRELRSDVDGLRNELQTLQDKFYKLQEQVIQIQRSEVMTKQITIDEATMQQIVGTLEFMWRDVSMNEYAFEKLEEAITAARAAIARAEKHEDRPWELAEIADNGGQL